MAFWNISSIADTIQNRFRDQAEFGAGAALIEEKHEIYMELNGISDDGETPYFSRDLFLEIKGDGKIDVLLQGHGGSSHKVFSNPVEAMDWVSEEMNLYDPKFLKKMKSQSRRFQAAGSEKKKPGKSAGSEFTLYKDYMKAKNG